MVASLEERVLSYIRANSIDGRLIIKRGDLAAQLGETVCPVSRTIRALTEQKRLVSVPRSRMGIELQLIGEQQIIDDTKVLSFEQILGQIHLLNRIQLLIIKDVVEANIMRAR